MGRGLCHTAMQGGVPVPGVVSLMQASDLRSSSKGRGSKVAVWTSAACVACATRGGCLCAI